MSEDRVMEAAPAHRARADRIAALVPRTRRGTRRRRKLLVGWSHELRNISDALKQRFEQRLAEGGDGE